MSKKHYERIMSRRGKRIEKVAGLLEQQVSADSKPEPLYMDANSNIDWDKLAKHVREATSGR